MDSLVTATWIFTSGGITDTFHVSYIFGNYGNYVIVITINCAKSMVSYMAYINIANYLGIANESVQKLNIYPNPFTGLFYVKLPPGMQGAYFQVYNYTGQVVYSTMTYSLDNTIDASKWSEGVYSLRVLKGQNQMITSKIIKQ